MFTFLITAVGRSKENINMYLDDLIDSLTIDPFTPIFSSRKALRAKLDGRVTVDGDTLKISIDAPGVKKDDVDITFEAGDTIKIVAKRADTGETSTWRYVARVEWDREAAEATLSDGVLTIAIPRRSREASRRLLVK